MVLVLAVAAEVLLFRWLIVSILNWKALAAARAQATIAQETQDILDAEQWLERFSECPKCHSKDGVIGCHDDCMQIVLDYCDHAWHSLKLFHGTRGNLTRSEALLEYGKQLRTAKKGKA